MAYEAYESITVDVADGVATVQFHRPDKLNALSTTVMQDVRRAFDEIQLDRSIDVVVIEGEGEEAFSAGADIQEYAGPAEEHDPRQKDRQDLFYDIYRQPYESHATTIAKIDGWAVGGGLILALFCDMRVATEGSSFGVPTCNIGQIPTGGSNYRAIQLVGEAKAKELILTAGFIDAEEAHRIGLINRVAEDADALDEEVQSIVDAIQDTGRQAVKNSKRALNQAANAESMAEAREFERDLWWEQFDSEERRRLVDEFNEE
ncbi:enoyl-CoA hydratase/isomerase family protein [Haloplanus sp. GCM10025708]|uniref:enoyl-CoA hydratase/isomerase family protein n=1 Tax=Haloferacaceae TaxID=1644056 RepID=UPI00360B6A05